MKEDKKGKTSLIVIIVIMFACITGLIWMVITGNQDVNPIKEVEKMSCKTKAVVVKVNESSLFAELEEEGLCSVSFGKNGNIGFKKGQEIEIYFDGMINASYPGGIANVGKIKILNDESGKEISKGALQYCYSSKENVEIEVEEFTKEKVVIKVKDTNELPYEYSDQFKILKKNDNYVEPTFDPSRVIGGDTENSSSGYLRTRKSKL
ncbi:MAG: hypothetical protein HFJ51_04020 [Clostridia bacterium]|nr:hypothetical protein [Clostridia bacterium]